MTAPSSGFSFKRSYFAEGKVCLYTGTLFEIPGRGERVPEPVAALVAARRPEDHRGR
jgi:hypothetical protein